ncbi:PREDICTED: 39S ribosomal protein L54, mitochondrial [Papilio xuthus]|uniref:Large ribosomal subunit protein mL54 n=1 Tax=Papilio xuthus TaxID=66420 RepID=A0A194QK96_PAPXU|nr:PREDICTED: 39S ribosomal protein L54, mitochondrial [Papilio xuthus]KPJ03881.1 39S ribosomal protein L54, mitochondrial [Papilio xuthus]
MLLLRNVYPTIAKLNCNVALLPLIANGNAASLHTTAISCAVVKKTTAAAGGVLGLGKGKKKVGKLGAVEKKELPVETDPEKLVSQVCGSNIYITGEDVKLKDDSEYPEWLWTLDWAPKKLDELDPNSKAYWQRVRAAGMRRNNRLKAMKKF